MRVLRAPERPRARLTAALLLAVTVFAAGCTESGDPGPPTAGGTSTPPALGSRSVSLAEYGRLTEGTPIQRKPEGRQVSLLALAADGVALINTRKDVQPDSVDGIYLAAGQLKLSYPARHVESIPGTQRAVEAADLTERHALWTERLGPVEDGFVSVSGRSVPDGVLRSYDRTTHVITTITRIAGRDPADSPEIGTPLVVGDRAVWTVFHPGRRVPPAAPTVFSRRLDGTGPTRFEVTASATASDGRYLWYATPARLVADTWQSEIRRHDLTTGASTLLTTVPLNPGGVSVTGLAAADGALVWSTHDPEATNSVLTLRDTNGVLTDLGPRPLAYGTLRASSGLLSWAAPGGTGGPDEGRTSVLDRATNTVIDLGTSCCPNVLVAGRYLVWDDGTVYRRATLTT